MEYWTAMSSEESGRRRLKECFSKAGYAIVEDHRFVERGLDVVVDGFDPVRRVGYEFVTSEAGDRERFPPQVLAEIETRMQAGEFYLLVVDEIDTHREDCLAEAASAFLDEVRRRGAEA